MLEDSVLERDEPALEELENPQSVLGSLHEPNGEPWKEEARVRLRQEGPAAKQPVSPEPAPTADASEGGRHFRRFRERCRRPLSTSAAAARP